MKVSIQLTDDNYLFEGTNSAGNKILLDNTSGPNPQGVSPMESILMATAACSAIDIVSILKKQRQTITSFSAEVEGERVQMEEAKPFRTITVTFLLEGEITPQKALNAAALSFGKYCSVSKTLEPGVEVKYQVMVNGDRVHKQA